MMKASKQSRGFIYRTTVLVTTLSLFCLASTCAQAATWDGDTSQYWSDVGNWDVAPVSGNNLTFDGTGNQSNTNNAGITSIGTLTLSNGGWDIALGTISSIQGISATGDSTLKGNMTINADANPRTIALNGAAGTTTLTIANKLTFTRANNTATLTVNGTGNTLILGSLELGSSGGNKTISGTANVTVNGALTDTLSAGTSFIWSGSGTLTLNGVNTYDCYISINAGTMLVNGSLAASPITINGATLALGPVGSISKVTSITLNAGGTFDVSAQSAYTLSTNLFAKGTATAATIKGATAGTVSLGTLPLKLQWSGALSGIVTTNPPLTVTQAQLVLNNNTITVTNSLPFAEGQYTLISAPAGITGTVNSTPVYQGGGKDPNLGPTVRDSISISGNSVILTITVPPRGTMISLR
jgi:autotransporter-associated beta strand protein